MRLLVTRPEPEAGRLAERLRQRGHEVLLAPLLRIEPLPEQVLPSAEPQALIATSRNALKSLAGRPELSALRRLPIHVVGEGTAETARGLGFGTVYVGAGTARDLAASIAARCRPGDGPLLWLRGEEVAFDLETALVGLGLTVVARRLYRSVAAEQLPAPVVEALRVPQFFGVLLLSPRTAEVFARLAVQHVIAEGARKQTFFCLSSAVAAELEALAPVAVNVSERPTLQSLLELVECHEAARGS